jgi:hypothetical protein
MKRVAVSLVVAATLASSAAIAADMAVKAPPPAPAPSPWDIAITGALMSDYNFRGITQSNHQPSVQFGVEPRYNFTKDLQGYIGVSGESIDFPNRAAAEIDFYGGIRPTFDKLALDFGGWYYFYPDGQCFGPVVGPGSCNALGGGPSVALTLPNGNVVKQDLSFVEGYGKATYTVNDNFNFGGSIWGSPSVLNSGAPGIYYAGNVTFTAPSNLLPNGIGVLFSADVGWWQLGTSDAFYAAPPAFPTGVPYTSYLNWDAGLSFTWKIFTLDFRYYQSSLTKAECDVFTSDHTSSFSPGSVTAQNPSGLASNWCGADFVVKLSVATAISALK